MKYKRLVLPLWDRYIYLLLGGDWEYILKIALELKFCDKSIREIKSDRIQGNDRGAAYFCEEGGMGILWFPNKKPKPYTIAHESTHIADFTLKFIGAFDEMEARAYTVDWLVENIPISLKKM